MKSLSYSLVLLILKIKKVKSTFRQTPIPYKQLRKEDMLRAPGKLSRLTGFAETHIGRSVVHRLKSDDNHQNKLVLFFHGGAFVSGPAQHHWKAFEAISRKTDADVWLCVYPKAPETNIKEISNEIDLIYQHALASYEPSGIVLLGDSVGGSLALSLGQRLTKSPKSLPAKIILITPVLDSSMSNPTIQEIEPKDPMLALPGVLSAKQMAADTIELKSPLLSPIYGPLDNLPEIILFLAENDIMRPDTELFIDKLKQRGAALTVYLGDGMPHIWPLIYQMDEGRRSFRQLLSHLT